MDAAAAPGRVRPLAARDVLAGWGVAAHPAFQSGVYHDVEAFLGRLSTTGVRTIRGLYDPNNDGCLRAVAACRRLGVGWIMEVVPEAVDRPTGQDPATTAAVVRQIAKTCPDVCQAIEGINEPNANHGGVPTDWATAYAAPHQQAIWETVRSSSSLAHVEVIGPSLNDVVASASYRLDNPAGGPRHFEQLADAGLEAWLDRVGLHSYPAGQPPTNGLEARLELIRTAFGQDTKVHITELGYNNSLYQPTNAQGTYQPTEDSYGPAPTSEDATGTYLPRALLQTAAVDLPCVWYELLDDPDPPPKDVPDSNYGLWRVESPDPASWSAKPAATALSRLAATLSEPDGPPYQTGEVALSVAGPTDVTSMVTATRDEKATAHLFRDLPVWDPVKRQPITVAVAPVVVTDAVGARTFQVGADVVSVPLRQASPGTAARTL